MTHWEQKLMQLFCRALGHRWSRYDCGAAVVWQCGRCEAVTVRRTGIGEGVEA